jgi:hypothetical protein
MANNQSSPRRWRGYTLQQLRQQRDINQLKIQLTRAQIGSLTNDSWSALKVFSLSKKISSVVKYLCKKRRKNTET